jgi:hypothetical protein
MSHLFLVTSRGGVLPVHWDSVSFIENKNTTELLVCCPYLLLRLTNGKNLKEHVPLICSPGWQKGRTWKKLNCLFVRLVCSRDKIKFPNWTVHFASVVGNFSPWMLRQQLNVSLLVCLNVIFLAMKKVNNVEWWTTRICVPLQRTGK